MTIGRTDKILIYVFGVAIVLGFVASLLQAKQQHEEILTALYAETEIQGYFEEE